MNPNPRAIPIPERMRHLPLDKRGYPIFVIALRDPKTGLPVFTANDANAQDRCIKRDACHICGTKLFRGRWFVGGPLSAFHEDGQYADGPMHHDCMSYAMRVCPYLAAPNYTKDLAARMAPKLAERGRTTVEVAALKGQPPVFVAGMCFRIEIIEQGFLLPPHYKPVKPWRQIEYWRGGQQTTEAEAAPLIADYVRMRAEQEPSPRIVHQGVVNG